MAEHAPQVCPSCAFERDARAAECLRCGIVFARLHAREEATPDERRIEVHTEYAEEPAAVAWKLFGIGAVAALLVHALPFVRLLLSPLVTLLHELGHTLAAWALGCPAIPAFDFAHGGGVTHQQAFQPLLAWLIGGGWLALGWLFRRNLRTLAVVGAAAALWLLAVSVEWHREVVIAAMGHGGELLFAGILMGMALTGHGWRRPEIERPLGAFAGWFVLLETLRFALRLTGDEAFVASYREGKGGAMMHDLEVIALDLHIWTAVPLTVERVAVWLIVASLVVPVAVGTLFALRRRVAALAQSLRVLQR